MKPLSKILRVYIYLFIHFCISSSHVYTKTEKREMEKDYYGDGWVGINKAIVETIHKSFVYQLMLIFFFFSHFFLLCWILVCLYKKRFKYVYKVLGKLKKARAPRCLDSNKKHFTNILNLLCLGDLEYCA